MDLTDVAVDLYGLPVAEFTAARTARAKQAKADGDRDLAARITALRKPTVAAWAVNLLVRECPDDVERVLALGAALQEAQAALDGSALRELGKQQHELLGAVRRQVDALAADAGQRLSDTVDVQVEGTLRAAMADAAAAAAVRSGLLTSELVSTGFEPVDVHGAVAVPGAPSLTGAAAEVHGTGPQGTPAEDQGEVAVLPGRGRRATKPDAKGADDGGSRRAPHEGSRDPSRTAAEASDEAQPAPAEPARPRGSGGRASQGDDEARRRRAEQESAAHERARQERRAQAEREVEEAEQEAADAAEALSAAEAAVEDVTRRNAEIGDEIETLTARLRVLRDEQMALTVRERRADSAREAAARAVDAAARRVRAARQKREHLD